MDIKNKGNIFSDFQLMEIIALLKPDYQPSALIVCENRCDMLHYFTSERSLLPSLLDISLWLGKTEGFYLYKRDVAVLFTFAQTDDGDDLHSRQLYTIHALFHELYHRHIAARQIELSEAEEELEADKFATRIVNKKSSLISQIMNWADEWSMWEEG